METFPKLDWQIYARPAIVRSLGELDSWPTTCRTGGIKLPTVAVEHVDAGLMQVTFEVVLDRLSRAQRCHAEPDGSFVWTGQEADNTWQIDGMLYDRAGRMQRVEVQGTCPKRVWLSLLEVLGAPQCRHVVHLRPQGCFVEADRLVTLWSSHARP